MKQSDADAQEYFWLGYGARQAGEPRSANPFAAESAEAKEWWRGWDAFDDWAVKQF